MSWNSKMAVLPGHRHRFNIRRLAVPADPLKQPIVLHEGSDAVVRSMNQNVHIKLGKGRAKALRSARDVVFSVSQQCCRPTNGNKLYERNFANTAHLRRNRPMWPAPGANPVHDPCGPTCGDCLIAHSIFAPA